MEIAVKQEVGKIEFNFEEIKNELELNLKKYKGLVISDESQVKEIKADKSKLNKIYKAINDEKIRIKKEYCQPLIDFEDNVKVLLSMIKEVVDPIDSQVKAYEQLAKDKKKELIIDYFNTLNMTLVPFERLFDERYLNTTFKEKEWKEDLKAKVDTIHQDLDFINLISGDDEYKQRVKVKYLDCLDKTVAIDMVNDEVKREKALLQAQQEREQQQEVVQPIIEQVDHSQEMEVEQEKAVEEYIVDIRYRFNGVKDKKIELLKNFMEEEQLDCEVLRKTGGQ